MTGEPRTLTRSLRSTDPRFPATRSQTWPTQKSRPPVARANLSDHNRPGGPSKHAETPPAFALFCSRRGLQLETSAASETRHATEASASWSSKARWISRALHWGSPSRAKDPKTEPKIYNQNPGQNPNPKTRSNQKPRSRIRNPKPETKIRNPSPKTLNAGRKVRNPTLETQTGKQGRPGGTRAREPAVVRFQNQTESKPACSRVTRARLCALGTDFGTNRGSKSRVSSTSEARLKRKVGQLALFPNTQPTALEPHEAHAVLRGFVPCPSFAATDLPERQQAIASGFDIATTLRFPPRASCRCKSAGQRSNENTLPAFSRSKTSKALAAVSRSHTHKARHSVNAEAAARPRRILPTSQFASITVVAHCSAR